MRTLTKSVLIGSTLLIAAGASLAATGTEAGCHGPRGGMMQGMGPGMNGQGVEPGMRMGHGRGGMMKHGMQGNHTAMLDRIPNLTDDQRQQLTELMSQQQKKMQGFRSQMMAQREGMKAQVEKILTDEQKAALPMFNHR